MHAIDIKSLQERNLTLKEAVEFIRLLCKIKPTAEDEESYDTESEEGIPFEGGMGFTEALTALVRANENNYYTVEEFINFLERTVDIWLKPSYEYLNTLEEDDRRSIVENSLDNFLNSFDLREEFQKFREENKDKIVNIILDNIRL